MSILPEVALLILLLVISFLAAVLSGVAGFGGALILLPVLINVVGVKAAVPVLTIAQLFGNGSRVWFGRNELQWKPISNFLVTALPLSVLGSYLFTQAHAGKLNPGIGAFLILMVLYRRFGRGKAELGNRSMLLGGGITGLLSGLAGSAGPVGAAFFLGLNLPAVAYIASEAFTALVMHLVKTIIYNRFALIGWVELSYGLFIGMAMIAGSYTGKKLAEKLSREKFTLFVELLLIASGIQLIVTAL
ncbi:MAG: sulfite exporter TauE/SafE family protein [Cyclobacteriaceae bacterium]|nr:sulfite exporter TauE/SafE family protein [Cyclobacteriaceae bacterium]